MMSAFFLMVSPYLYEGGIKSKILMFFSLAFLSFLGGQLVYYAGGTHLPYVHLLYIPIIIAGFWLGIFTGITFAIFIGLMLGPFMPLDVVQDIPQTTPAWLLRTAFFAVIALLSGMGAQITRAYLKVLKRRYLTDHETKLPNYKGLEALYKEEERFATLSGVVIVKLRQVKEVEKAFGLDTMSYVAVKTKERLKELLPKGTLLGRISSDGFAICLENKEEPLKIAHHLSQHLARTYKFDKIPFLIEMYFGAMAHVKGEADSLKILVKKALVAADHGMQNSLEVCAYNEETQDFSERNIYILHELREAIEQDKLSLNYQPIISLSKNEVIGVEALARWGHSKMGMVSPLEFTRVAEQTQLINPYTKWLLKKSLSQLAEWRKKGLDFVLSLNFSMKNFEDPTVVQEIFHFLEEYHIPPQMLEVEVTETAIARNIGKASDILQSLRERGIKVAIDDFGTGQSSLNYLFELPVDVLKIDQVFVRSMLDNSAAEAIIRSAIMMGHEMNLKVIAEGIETKEQLAHLKKLGCDYGQGYYISRPMPVELATTWLDAKRSHLMKIQA
tara:strand:- start:1074 stop:2747 length:1674 start_codon:yes stop_codon:yes gene_type:complete